MPSELAKFQEFLAAKVAQGQDLSPEEALDLWRASNPAECEPEATIKALKAALQDLANGDTGRPFDEFDAEFQARHFAARETA